MKPPSELSTVINKSELQALGVKIGKLYTDHGLPIDMALNKLGLDKNQTLLVLFGAQGWLIEHKRNSNATDAALERQRKVNREVLNRFIKTGETGVY